MKLCWTRACVQGGWVVASSLPCTHIRGSPQGVHQALCRKEPQSRARARAGHWATHGDSTRHLLHRVHCTQLSSTTGGAPPPAAGAAAAVAGAP